MAAAASRVVPLSKVQNIFAEKREDLNQSIEEMKDRVTSLMHGIPRKGPGAPNEGRNRGATAKAPAAPASSEVREHACWLWSRLGVSLMALEDRNAWLVEENKRLLEDWLWSMGRT
eukprot:Skav203601  [mRNA]  locus=scaffold935:298111:299638:+ [translate_table: standard]